MKLTATTYLGLARTMAMMLMMLMGRKKKRRKTSKNGGLPNLALPLYIFSFFGGVLAVCTGQSEPPNGAMEPVWASLRRTTLPAVAKASAIYLGL